MARGNRLRLGDSPLPPSPPPLPPSSSSPPPPPPRPRPPRLLSTEKVSADFVVVFFLPVKSRGDCDRKAPNPRTMP